jgi:hypothetical protein
LGSGWIYGIPFFAINSNQKNPAAAFSNEKRLQHIWQVKLILFDKRKVLHRSVVGKWLHHHTNCIFLLSHLCTIVHPRLDHDDVDGNIQGARQCHVFGADFLNAQTGFFKH